MFQNENMKKFLFVIPLFFCSLVMAQLPKGVITDTVIYKVKIFDPDNNNSIYSYYHDNIETSKRRAFLETMYNAIFLEVRLEVSSFYSGNNLSIDSINKIRTIYNNTIYVSKDSVVSTYAFVEITDINSILFKEQWTIDTIKNKINKEVLAFCPLYDVYEYSKILKERVLIAQKPLFWIKPKGKPSTTSKEITDRISYFLYPNEIHKDTLNKVSQTTTNLVNYTLLKHVMKNNPMYLDENFTEPNTIKQLHDDISPDLIDSPATLKMVKAKNLDGLGFQEKWSFDLQTATFTKEIIGISCNKTFYIEDDESGKKFFKGFKPIFFIKMN